MPGGIWWRAGGKSRILARTQVFLPNRNLLRIFGERALCGQGLRRRPEPIERQFLRHAQIDAVEPPLPATVGAPVPASAFVSRLLAPRREGPDLAAKGEGRGGAQPGIPGWCIHGQLDVPSVVLV